MLGQQEVSFCRPQATANQTPTSSKQQAAGATSSRKKQDKRPEPNVG